MTPPERPSVAYVDSSALVKLVLEEPESEALLSYLAAARPRVVSSILAAVEVPRAIGRAEPDDVEAARSRAAAVIRETVLLELTLTLAERAAAASPRELRAADAVHLVSALALGSELSAFVAYDRRLLAAARAAGLPATAPRGGAQPS